MTIAVRAIEEIPPEPAGSDQVWYRVDYDDGTIPGHLKVYLSKADHRRLVAVGDVGDEYAWIRAQVAASVADVAAYDQGVTLRRSSPLALRY